MMKHIFLILMFIMTVMSLLVSCKRTSPNREVRVPVEVYKVRVDSSVFKQGYTGVVEERKASMLSFQIPGNIEFVNARKNQKVVKGQVLAGINKQILQDNYDAALSTLKQVEDAYFRMELLYKNNSLPEIKWIETQTALQKARSATSIAKKNLQNAILVAPFSGMITARMAETGMIVSAGMPLFRLTDMDSIKIKISVSESEISKIQIGQKCEFRVSALNKGNFIGIVTEKGSIANLLSHTYEIVISLQEKVDGLLPGMICHVDIFTDEFYPQIILPASVIQLDGSRTYVWVAEDGIAKRKEVNVGKLRKNGVMIEYGLKEGDQVIVNGYQKISSGTKVELK